MDPELVKAIRSWLRAAKVAREQGVTFSPEQVDAFLREETGGAFGYTDAQEAIEGIDTSVNARNLGRSALQGATFNFADEMVGLFSDDAREEMRLRQDLFRQQHPVAANSAEIAGGIAVPGVGAARLGGAGLRTLPAMVRGAEAGAVAGALDGAGRAENTPERVSGALGSGVAGAVGGAALPGVVGGYRAVTSPSRRATARVGRAIDRSGDLQGRVADFVAADRGNEMILGDLSEHLRREADFAANANDDVLVGLSRIVRDRQGDASDRLLQDARAGIGGDPVADDIAARIRASRSAFANSEHGYAGLRARYPQVDAAELSELLQQPVVADALRRAKTAGLIGETPDLGNPSFQMLQDVKEALDDAASVAFRSGRGNLGSRLSEARDLLVEGMEDRVAGYRGVTSQYRQFSETLRALEDGQKAWNEVDTRGLAARVDGMSDEQREAFRHGMASEMIAKLRNAATNRDVARQMMDASPALQDKLRVVFGDEQTFRAFMERAGIEAELARMRGPISGSETARRLAAQGFDPITEGATSVVNPSGILSRFIQGAAGRASRAANRRTAGHVGDMLTVQGAPNIMNLLSQFGSRPPMVGPFANTAVPVGLGIFEQE